MINRCHFGHVFDVLPRLAGLGARCCVTSPPYWGLRDYGVEGQLGHEPTPEEFVANMVRVFRMVWDALADDGTLWLNLGDSYAGARHSDDALEKYGQKHGMGGAHKVVASRRRDNAPCPRSDRKLPGLKPKDLVGIPWMVAFALRTDGWYLRRDIIWHKPNPMPESAKDRPTIAHEYVFLLAKRERYYYDAEAIKEMSSENTHARVPAGWDTSTGDGGHGRFHKDGRRKLAELGSGVKANTSMDSALAIMPAMRNKRDVWTVATQPYARAHFATYPPNLIKPCILAGSAPGDIVLDPFLGSGTTAMVAQQLGRQWVGCELNEDNEPLQAERISQMGMPLGGATA